MQDDPKLIEAPKESNQVQESTNLKLDDLGPMVIQTDGTMQRIVDWNQKTPEEKEQIIRLISKRNKQRLANLAQ